MIAFDIEVLCDLLRDSNLSSKARLCYFVLHWFASKKNGCFPSYNDLAYTMNVSKESVNKAINFIIFFFKLLSNPFQILFKSFSSSFQVRFKLLLTRGSKSKIFLFFQ